MDAEITVCVISNKMILPEQSALNYSLNDKALYFVLHSISTDVFNFFIMHMNYNFKNELYNIHFHHNVNLHKILYCM